MGRWAAVRFVGPVIAALIVASMLAIVPADAQTAPEPPVAPEPDRYSDLVLADSPLAYYRFESTSGPEVFDASGGGHHATLGPAAALGARGVTAISETRAVIDPSATTGVVAPPPGSPRSVELWWSTETVDSGWIVRWGDASPIGLWYEQPAPGPGGAPVLQAHVGAGRVESFELPPGWDLTDGAWHHYALVVDGATVRLYVDTYLVGARDVDGVSAEDQAPRLTIGGLPGTYDEVAVYDTALAPARVAARVAGATSTIEIDPTACGVDGLDRPDWAREVAATEPVMLLWASDPSLGGFGRAALDLTSECVHGAVAAETRGAPSFWGSSYPFGDLGAAATTGAQPTIVHSGAGLPTGASPRTAEVWARSSASTDGWLFRWGGDSSFGLWYGEIEPGTHGYRIRFGPAETDVVEVDAPGFGLDADRWSQYVVTYGDGELAFYIDGALILRRAGVAPSTDAGAGLLVGEYPGAYEAFVAYDRALSAGEVAHGFAIASDSWCYPYTDEWGFAGLITAEGAAVAHATSLWETWRPMGSRVVHDTAGNCRTGAWSSSTLPSEGANGGDTAATSVAGHPLLRGTAELVAGDAPRSIELWMRTTGSEGGWLARWGQEGAFGVRYEPDVVPFGALRVVADGDRHVDIAFSEHLDLADGSWHQVVVTYDAGRVVAYLDGFLLGDATFTEPLATTLDSGLDVGRLPGDYQYVVVYDSALGPEQVGRHLSYLHRPPSWEVEERTPGGCAGLDLDPTYGTVLEVDEPLVLLAMDPAVGGRVAFDLTANCRNGALDIDAEGVPSFLPGRRGATGITTHSGAGFPVGGDDRTVELWVRPDEGASGSLVRWGAASPFDVRFLAGERVVHLVTGTRTSSFPLAAGQALDDGDWHHLAVTAGGGNVRLYVDGQLVGVASGVTLDTSGDRGVEIGLLSGAYDAVAVYDRVLPPARLAAHAGVVGLDQPTVVVDGPAEARAGEPVTFTATVVSADGAVPTGEVEFVFERAPVFGGGLAGASIGQGPGWTFVDSGRAPLVDGVASLAITLPAGELDVTARYLGDDDHLPALSEPWRVWLADGVRSTVTVELDQATVPYGTQPTATVRVAPTDGGDLVPTGRVWFSVQGIDVDGYHSSYLTLDGGQVSYQLPVLPAGSYVVRASYDGDTTFRYSQGTTTLTVTGAVPSVAMSLDRTELVYSEYGWATVGVTFGPEASPVAGGTVWIRSGESILGSGTVSNGVATVRFRSYDLGTVDLVAEFRGYGDLAAASSAPATVVVSPVPTNLSVSVVDAGQVAEGRPVGIRVNVWSQGGATVAANGEVIVSVDGVDVASGRVWSASSGLVEIPGLALGSHTIQARFVGDDRWLPSASEPVTLAVRRSTQITRSALPRIAVVGQGVDLSVVVSSAGDGPVPTGQVRFLRSNGTVLATATLDSAGRASARVTSLGIGTNTIRVSYLGDGAHAAQEAASLVVRVDRARTRVAVSTVPAVSGPGTPVQLRATMSALAPGGGTPSGYVSFFADGELVGTASGGPTATLTATFDTPGPVEITASFGGSTLYEASTSAPVTHLVAVPTSVELVVDPDPPVANRPVAATATVTAGDGSTPVGEVELLVDGSSIGVTPVVDGVAGFVLEPLGAGTRTVVARFRGEAHGPSEAVRTLEVTTAATEAVLVVDPAEALVGQPVAASVSVRTSDGDPVPGFVTIFDGDDVLATLALDAQGDAAATLASLPVGTRDLRAVYGGTAVFAPAESLVVSVPVSAAATRVQIAADAAPVSPGAVVSVDVSVRAVAPGGGVPRGQVRLLGDGVEIAHAELVAGAATFEVSAPAVEGVWRLTASYDGSTDHVASVSDPFEKPVHREALVTVSPPAAPTRLGDVASFEVVVTGPGSVPTGTVRLAKGSSLYALGTLVDGRATLATPSLVAGVHELTVLYSGDAEWSARSVTATHEVLVAPTTLQLHADQNPVGRDQNVRLTAIVVPDAVRGPSRSGFVTFRADGEVIGTGTVDSRGYAAVTVRFDTIRSYELTASFGGDANYAPSTSPTTSLEVVEPVGAAFSLDRAEGVAPFAVSVDATASTGTPTSYTWDFGDGTVLIDASAATTHLYETPGIYTVTLTVRKAGLRDYASRSVVVIADAPLAAAAGDDRNVNSGDEVVFNGRLSTPEFGIDTYIWNYGDGTTSTGPIGRHTYTTAGTYTVTLTVYQGETHAIDTATVNVAEPDPLSGLHVDVVNRSGQYISGAQVLATDPIDGRFEAVTGADGTAVLSGLADSSYSVYVMADGFRPSRADVVVADGFAQITVQLTEGDIGVAEIETRRLTYDEIVEAGIDVANPANRNVTEFEVVLFFGEFENTPAPIRVNEVGHFVGSPGCTVERCSFEVGPGRVTGRAVINADGSPSVWWLVLPGEASWLKEFFEVKLVVTNLATADFAFTQGTARLNLPAGLTLAPTRAPQSLSVPMDDIVGGSTAEASWILRGDTAGQYDISASYTGLLYPFGSSVRFDATSDDPLVVWGANAMSLSIVADDRAATLDPYRVTATLTNVSDATVYGAALQFKSEAEIAGDGTVIGGSSRVLYQPRQQFRWTRSSLAPGESITAELRLVAPNDGELNLDRSFVYWIEGEVHDPDAIAERPALEDIPELRAEGGGLGVIGLSWDDAGTGPYEVFVAPLEGSGGFVKVDTDGDPGQVQLGETSFQMMATPGDSAIFAVRGLNGEMVHNAVVATAGSTPSAQVTLRAACSPAGAASLVAEFEDTSGGSITGLQLVQVVPGGTTLVRARLDAGELSAGQVTWNQSDLDGWMNTTAEAAHQTIGSNPGVEVRSAGFYVRVHNDTESYLIPAAHATGMDGPSFELPDGVVATQGYDLDGVLDVPAGMARWAVWSASNGVGVDLPCNWRDLVADQYEDWMEGQAQGTSCMGDGGLWSKAWAVVRNPLGSGACVLDPIHPVTGNLVTAAEDAASPGVGIPFSFQRTYNSTDDRSGPLGRGWTHSFDIGLDIPVDPDWPVVLRREDGQRLPLHRDGVAPSGADLYRLAGTDTRLVANPVGDHAYTLYLPDLTVYEFDAAGALIRMRDRNDQGLDLTWVDGQLRTVTDEAGRTVTFTYTGERITQMRLADGRTVAYAYDGDLLRFVTDVRGHVTEYRYADGRLVEEVDQLGRRVHLTTYDPETGRAVRQEDGRGAATTLAWDPATETVAMTDHLGATTTIRFRDLQPIDATDALGNQSSYSYDPVGRLTRVVDARGNATTMQYDEAGNLVRRVGPGLTPAVEQYGYDGDNNRIWSVDRNGERTDYRYDTLGRLIGLDGPDGREVVYDYDERGLLEWSEDSLGRRTTFGYDGHGNLTAQCDPLGRCTTMTYDGEGRLLATTGPGGASVSFEYDAAGNSIAEVDPRSGRSTFSYDAVGNLLQVTDPAGQVRRFTYDVGDELLTEALGAAPPTRYEYDVLGRLTRMTNPAGEWVTFAYDSLGRTTSQTDALGRTTRYEYDAVGNLTATIDASGARSATIYDAVNRPVQITDALGETTEVAYDPMGNVAAVTDPLGAVTRIAYDGLGRPIRVTGADGSVTRTEYRPTGEVARTIDPEGGITTYEHDPAGQLTSVVEPRGNVAGGDPAAHRTTFVYDLDGDLVETIDPLGGVTRAEHDVTGNVTRVVDAEGRATRYEYDAVSRVVAVEASDGAVTRYEYDGSGDLVRRTDPRGNVTSYLYDQMHRLVRSTDPLGNSYQTGYDQVGNVAAVIDPLGRSTTMTYDARNLVTRIDYEDASTPDVTYQYDALGRVAAMVDGLGTETYTYDGAGRTVATSRDGRTFEYGYDPVGNITSRLYPDGSLVEYGFDDAARMTSIAAGGLTSTIDYDAAGLPTGAALGNQTAATYAFDRLGRPADQQIVGPGGAPVTSQTRTFDRVGNPLDEATPFGTVEYGYDARHRLTSEADGSGTDATYAYDGSSNRTAQTAAGLPVAYTYDEADRLVERIANGVSTTYSYDALGNLVDDGEWAYTYDQLNRLVRAERHEQEPGETTTYDEVVLASSPAAYWSFDVRSEDGSFPSLAGAGAALTPPSDPRPTPIAEGAVAADGALRFDGVDDRVLFRDPGLPARFAGSHTVEFFLRAQPGETGTVMAGVVAEPLRAWDVVLRPDGHLRLSRGPVTLDSGVSVATGQWVHVALVRDGRTLRWVVDGRQTASVSSLSLLLDLLATSELRVGYDAAVDLDELAVTGRALSASRLAGRAAGSATHEAHVLADAPASYWRMGDARGVVRDRSGNGRDGILAGDPAPAAAPGAAATAGAVRFDGVDDQLSVAETPAMRHSGSFSVELWARSDVGNDPGAVLLAKGPDTWGLSGWRIVRGAGGTLEYQRNGRTFASTPGALDAEWSHVALTFDGSWLRWWIDGELDSTHRVLVPFFDVFTTPSSLTIGDRNVAPIEIDGVAFFDRALGSEEIGRRVAPRGPPPGPEHGPEDAAGVVVFAYDGDGLRREKVVDGQVTRYDWDLLAGLAQVAVESGPDEVRRFVHDGASPVQVGVDGEEFFTHQDSLGSTVAVSDRSGAVVARFDYDGYGNVAASQVTGAVPEGLERFADATLDAETGLWFLRARYYDSTLGVFTAVDPIDTATGDPYVSRYSYVAGRPTTMVDPSGLKLVDAGYGFVSGTVQGIRYAVNNPSAVLASIGRSLEDGISLHTALDVLGMVPVIGEVFDLINGVYYLAEGNSVDAALSFAAVVPVVGSMAVGGRFVARNLDVVADSVRVTTRSMGRGVAALPMSVRRGYDQLAGFARTKVDNFRGALRRSDGVTDASATRTPSAPGGGTTRVYRVEGPGNARLDISPSGNVTAKGDNMLHLNFGDEARAQQFLAQRVSQRHADDVIKSFDVPTSFLDDVRAASVPQRLGRSHPNAPQLVDATKAADQYGLPACWIGRLNRAIVPGSGSTSC